MGEFISMEDAQKFAEEMRNIDWTNPLERRAVAQIIVKRLRDEMDKQDIVGILRASQETFKEGDTMQFITRKGGKAYVHAPGSAAPRSTITNRVQTLEAENISVNMEFELDQLRQGRYGSMNDVRAEARKALLYRKWKIVWDTIRGSVTSADAGYSPTGANVVATSKLDALDLAINHVEDHPGGATAIIGRRLDLNWLLNGMGTNPIAYSDKTKDSILSRGAIPVYRGLPIVLLNSWKDSYNVEVIQTGEVMVLNSSTLKIGVVKGIDALDDLDINSRIWNVVLNERYGVGVFFPERNGKLVFT